MVTPPPTTTPATPPTTLETLRRTISPYDLTAADNSGVTISHPLLTGDNYDEWACGFKMALISRKKFGFLDGSITRPAEGSPDLDDWTTIQALLVSWIRMTIAQTLRSNISHRDVAKELWDHLRKRFSVTSGPRIQQIKAELACCKQKGLTVETYYGKLNKIWDSMSSHRPQHVCKCGRCVCDLGAAVDKEREEDRVHQFLFGLDDTMFRTVRSSLVSRQPLPSLEEVYNIVRQEEDLARNSSQLQEEHQEVAAFAAQAKYRANAPICKHCNRPGHVAEKCYGVVGYPEWWGDRPKYRGPQGRGRGSGRGRGVAYANAVSVPTVGQSSEQANYTITDKDRDGVTGLSDVQWQSLVSLLNAGRRPANASETLSGPCFEDGDWSG